MVLRSPYPDVEIPAVSLSEYVLGGAAARGDKPALIDGADGTVTTYAELADRVARAAAGLAAEGIGPGDAVGLLGPNSPAWAVAFHAVVSLGALVTSINPLLTPPEVAKQLESAQAVAVIVAEPLRGSLAEAGIERVFTLEALPDAAPGGRPRDRRPGARPRRAPVLQRHHRRVQGRHAHAPQPRREHGADPLRAPDRRRRRADRAAAVLPHLRPDRRREPRALAGRDDRHHAALRHGRLPRPARALPRHARARRAAGRARAWRRRPASTAATSRCASSSRAPRRSTPTRPTARPSGWAPRCARATA